ncbi:MAG: Tol-Pal system protein TolB, partial [Caulobacteraceae bacterium]
MHLRTLTLALFAAIASLLALAPVAKAEIVINVDQGATAPLPIAIPNIGGSPEGAQISQVITADLQRSGLFKTLDPASFEQKELDV